MRETKEGLILEVLVKPNARRDSVSLEGDLVVVETRERAEQGKANLSVIKMLSKVLGVSTSSVAIVRGRFDRNKSILIRGTGREIVAKIEAR
ncbi:MAG: YggU family protein [Candidatus Methanosuratus sp.]|nr:YggU family protein [Candidatus Methanosuratincola sp.]